MNFSISIKMITVGQINLLILFLIPCQIALSQGNCKVLKPELTGGYKGKCKDGLANGKGSAIGIDRYEGQFLKGLPEGKGTYTWATGESYTGYWREGKRNGEGEYTFFYNGNDSILAGNWENDRYTGPVPKKPQVIHKSNIDRYTFRKTKNIRNRILINLYQNGSRNTGISNLMISSSSGYDTSLGNSVGYDEVSFPVKILVKYTTLNKLKTATYDVEFEFEISESGDWIVDLHN
jgi:hypothetical protein